ncbi:hypothetical protein SLEP1_g13624 [Rubroshorea leprosula]|uniref:Uncharacterized protein n=1 Tax=Rubroshorea leprosula TaxID=152421 RepID=A0AAV5IMA1_9ROSI|nr:hypothetical protein SLEP1_g13624 [Rubroshorea leprosula]
MKPYDVVLKYVGGEGVVSSQAKLPFVGDGLLHDD